MVQNVLSHNMGVTASIADQQRLFDELRVHFDAGIDYQRQDSIDKVGGSDDEESGIDADYNCDANRELNCEQVMFNKVNATYHAWYRDLKLKENVSFCELIDFEETLEAAFKTGKTPLLLDSSSDDKLCTFFSYQPDAVILDAKSMVMANATSHSTKRAKSTTVTAPVNIEAIWGVMDSARKTLVNAMKFGKLLVIRLGTSAPDFVHTFSDDALGLDTSKASSAYFPLLVFEEAGRQLHDAKIEFGESRKVSSKYLASGGSFTNPIEKNTSKENTLSHENSVSMHGPTGNDRAAEPTWAERLFREEDMRPHKNFAMCRDTFRVCLISQLPLENIDEFLFGMKPETIDEHGMETVKEPAKDRQHIHNGSDDKAGGVYSGSLPSKEFFTVISIVPDAADTEGEEHS